MKKSKTVKPLVMGALEMSKHLMQPVNRWMTSPGVDEMTSFTEKEQHKLIFLNGSVVGPLDSLKIDNKTYISVEIVKYLGYSINRTRSRIEIQGINKIVVDPMTLKMKMNDVGIEIDAKQVGGVVYLNRQQLEDLTGIQALEKNSSLWITPPTKKFQLKTDMGSSIIQTFTVKDRSLYVNLFTILLALPSFTLKGSMLKDKYSNAEIDLSLHRKDRNYPIMSIIKQVNGKASLTKHGEDYQLLITHDSAKLAGENLREINFFKNLAAMPPIETNNLEEAVIHEINAYRAASGKSLVSKGKGSSIKGRMKVVGLTTAAKIVYTVMFSKDNKELLMSEIKSIILRAVGNELQILAYAN